MTPRTDDLLSPTELAAWRGMLRVTVRTRRELGALLQTEHDLTMAEYDTLVPVAASPGGRVRMADLAEEILQPKSSATRLVSGLEERGYLRRESVTEDGRGTAVALTALGRRRFTAAQTSHHRNVRALVTGRLSTTQQRQLAAAWRSVDPDVER